MSLETLWFALLGAMVSAYAALDGFDFGVGILSVFARRPDERRQLVQAIGPFWDGNEAWLVVFGGALLAAFPEAYATLFSGFYLALLLILVALILRAVALSGAKDPGSSVAVTLPSGAVACSVPADAATTWSCIANLPSGAGIRTRHAPPGGWWNRRRRVRKWCCRVPERRCRPQTRRYCAARAAPRPSRVSATPRGMAA